MAPLNKIINNGKIYGIDSGAAFRNRSGDVPRGREQEERLLPAVQLQQAQFDCAHTQERVPSDKPLGRFYRREQIRDRLLFRPRSLYLLPFGHGVLRVAEPGLAQDIPLLGQAFPAF